MFGYFTWGNKAGYGFEFKKAVKISKEIGIFDSKFKYSVKPAINPVSINLFQEFTQKTLGNMEPDMVSQQCFGVNVYMKKHLESIFEQELYYTLGYVTLDGNNVFYTDEDKLMAMLGRKPEIGPVNLHAWLTTGNLEIIDMTFSTTYGIVKNIPELVGRMSCMHHSEFNENMVYHPQFVGIGFLMEIGALLESPFSVEFLRQNDILKL